MSALQQTLVVAGLAVVISMLVAVVIQAIVVVLGRSGARRPLPAPTPPPAAPDTLPPAGHVAAIAAAVSVVLEGGRVVHIEPRLQEASWAAAGRQAHLSSHNLGPRTPRRPSGPRRTPRQEK